MTEEHRLQQYGNKFLKKTFGMEIL